jgi:hypothetical protein
MGYYTITLHHNIEGEVRWRKMIRRSTSFMHLLMPWKKAKQEIKTGYVVKLRSAFVKETEYRLFKTNEGDWFQDVRGKVEVKEPITKAITRAIEDYEKQSNYKI